MIKQAIFINGLESHLLCLMQCHLNGVHISEVPKFLADSPGGTTHADNPISVKWSHQLF